ncbi:pentatricopeptide repeat-containing protein At3g09040, mitochondrial-like [Selaginella moellendorffii]|uniref:pentatricopeptide repeat-containing protein At3g09040, mitochondrial-like n=1 Tax=Selaginella moellendorffii TaxID=88036 RepID=UPI000D1CE61F|nr:pentatricopeptide repeat-containing protein At3g09040, mitochondrial-like [Selaginella moellendorffii]|eukprot:XP_024542486.1 pentatricopeptide repeat-containing protein At3g09040, mitochondrial-like [Selaginella moellendorffii]
MRAARCRALGLRLARNLEHQRPCLVEFDGDQVGDSSQALLVVLKALKACSSGRDLEAGEKIYSRHKVFFSDLFVATAAVDMFAKCGSLEQAQMIFDSMAFHDVVSWNALIQGYVLHGREDFALDLFSQIQTSRETTPDSRTFIAALMACSQRAAKQEDGNGGGGSITKVSSLRIGVSLHSQVEKAGFESEVFVASALVDMYSSCGSMEDARMVFDKIAPARRDVVLWTGLIMGYVSNAQADDAFKLFELMTTGSSPCRPNARTFVAGIAACAALAAKEAAKLVEGKLVKVESLAKGSRFHSEATKRGFGSDLFLANCAVDMYAKCGAIARARQVFDGMTRRSVVSWTSLMMGYVENGEPEQALDVFQLMKNESPDPPNARSYVAALLACSVLASREQGRKITGGSIVKLSSLEAGMGLHSQASKQGFSCDVFVANTLIDMYAKCGSMQDACAVFHGMTQPDVVSWTSLILGFTANGQSRVALETLSKMEECGTCEPNARTYVAGLVACGNLGTEDRKLGIGTSFCLERGREIHSQVVGRGYVSDVFVVNSLITMYSKCGSLFEARQVFDRIKSSGDEKPDLVSWNALLSGYVDNGDAEVALELFARVESPDSRTFVAALSACCALASRETGEEAGLKVKSLEKGMAIHSQAVKIGVSSDIFVSNRLIDMYAKCGNMADSRKVFDRMAAKSSVSWTSLISGYADNGQPEVALELFEKMVAEKSCEPDARAFVAALSALSALASTETGETIDGNAVKVVSLERGRALHSRARSSGVELENDGFAANALIAFYSKCGSMIEACEAFEAIDRPDVAAWTVLMLGYSDNGQPEMALETFARMRCRTQPDTWAMVAVLVACGQAVAREAGRSVHGEIHRREEAAKCPILANSLLDFYAKCGAMDCAQRVFDSIADWRDVVAWNCLIAGYGRLGDSGKATEAFGRMREEGVRPSAITFVSVLTMCSHCGLVEEGRKCLESMAPKFGVHPTVQHYTCMVDLLARADRVEDAVSTVDAMPCYPDEVTWTAVMGAKARV